jgi:hypothetical protein
MSASTVLLTSKESKAWRGGKELGDSTKWSDGRITRDRAAC